jgi:hypothetical protein
MDGSRYGGACNRDGLGRGFHATRLCPATCGSKLKELTTPATQIKERTAPRGTLSTVEEFSPKLALVSGLRLPGGIGTQAGVQTPVVSVDLRLNRHGKEKSVAAGIAAAVGILVLRKPKAGCLAGARRTGRAIPKSCVHVAGFRTMKR